MRVRIGSTWYEPEPGVSIMLKLTDEEKTAIDISIGSVSFTHRDDTRSRDEILNWMEEGEGLPKRAQATPAVV